MIWARFASAVAAMLLLPSLLHDALGVARFGRAWFYIANGHPEIAVGAVLGSVLVLAAFALALICVFVRPAVARVVLLVLALASWLASLVTDVFIDARLAHTLGVTFDGWGRLRAWLGLQPASYYTNGGYYRPTLQWVASICFTLAVLAVVAALALSMVAAVGRPASMERARA
jgi:hypothetical protein